MIKQPRNAVLLCFAALSATAQEMPVETTQSARPARNTTANRGGVGAETVGVTVPRGPPPASVGSAPANPDQGRPIKPGEANSINPQPLPPRPSWDVSSKKPLAPVGSSSSPRPDWSGVPAAGSTPALLNRASALRSGDASSINPQPLPPRPSTTAVGSVQPGVPQVARPAPVHESSSRRPDWTGGAATWKGSVPQQSSRPSTTVGSSAQIAVDLSPKPPTGLIATNDQTVCAQHGGFAAGLACHALLPQGRLALVWSYGKDDRVKGYRVYRVDGGQQSLVYTQDAGVDAHSWVVDPIPNGGYAGKCYAVSAYGTSEESKPSAATCLDPGQSIQKLSLHPLQIRQYYKVNRKGRDPADGTLEGPASGHYAVGYNYTTTKNVGVNVDPFSGASVALDDYVNNISEVGVLFDDNALLFSATGQLRNVHILSANLLLTVDGAWTRANINFPSDAPNEHQTSCVARIGAASNFWWSDGQWVQSYAELAPGIAYGSTVSYDVKEIVAGWIDKLARNPYDAPKGFVLKAAEENLTAFTEKSCVTRYAAGSMHLEVTFRP